VIHIDFGFLLGISPGGNLGFETAAFKLSAEMFELLGGDFSAEPFLYFLDMTVKAFLIARELKSTLLAIISSFADSGFPCFMHKSDNIQRFLARFVPEMSDEEAAEHMRKLALDACKKWTTIVYDGIQKLQNNIYSDTWK
jgi:phosphatidylinositol 4-kinase